MKYFLWAIIMIAALSSFSQSAPVQKDTLVWFDGTVYVGSFLTENRQTGQVKFMTEDGESHTIAKSSIARLHTVKPIPETEAPRAKNDGYNANSKAYESPSSKPADDGPPINWSDPEMPHSILAKHRAGLGLGITGGVLFGGGAIMLIAGIASNGQTTTTHNSYSTQTNVSVGAAGFTGVLCILAGLPMMITGIVKSNKANKLARARMIRLK